MMKLLIFLNFDFGFFSLFSLEQNFIYISNVVPYVLIGLMTDL